MMYDYSLLVIVFLLALLYEIIDASLGQGYGTLGSPTFILLGFGPKMVVPSILISQAAGGLLSAFFHNKWKNADFSNHRTDDMKKVYTIIGFGVVGVIVASFVGFKLPTSIMSTYIGVMVVIIGILILSGITLKFTWKRLSLIGAVSAFNKGLSGGGYGPLVTGGQAIIGVGGKASVAVTDFAEAPICIVGFVTWFVLQGLPRLDLMLAMSLGAGIAPVLGAWITYKLPVKKLKLTLGAAILILGVMSLLKLLNP